MDILLEGAGAGPSSSETTHISSSSVSLSDPRRYMALALLNSPTWGETMACLFGAPPSRDLLLPPSSRSCDLMASFASWAAFQLHYPCGIPTTTSSPNITMLSCYHVVIKSRGDQTFPKSTEFRNSKAFHPFFGRPYLCFSAHVAESIS